MMHETRPIIAGSRGSRLALWQTRNVMSRIGVPCELKIIKTSGDRFQKISLQGQSQTGFFTKEIEKELVDGDIDFAVHSLKDLPTEINPDLLISAYLERAPVSDLLMVHRDWLDDSQRIPLKPGCRVGAGSLRRQSLMKRFAPHVTPDLIRGNVPTRIEKCASGEYGALVIARAGVDRLEMDTGDLAVFEFNPLIWLPAPGQGAIAVEVRKTDADSPTTVLDHRLTREAVIIERKLLNNFEGGCHTAFGAFARKSGDEWTVNLGLEVEGRGWVHTTITGSMETCMAVGPRSDISLVVPDDPGDDLICGFCR